MNDQSEISHKSAPPVLPYRAEGHERFASPIDEVYGTMGKCASVLSSIVVSSVITITVAPRFAGDVGTGILQMGSAICGGIAWIVSLTLAVVVSAKESVGRKWALLAVALNVVAMPALLFMLH